MSIIHKPNSLSRRNFLSGAALLGGFSPLALQLAASNASATTNDYKALVCLYLDGGLDHHHALIPTDPANYQALKTLRPGLGLPPRELLTPLTTKSGQGGLTVGLHPSLINLSQIYNAGKAAIVFGHGAMAAPATKQQLQTGAEKLPSAFGSHINGNFQIHTFSDETGGFGWGGLALDSLSKPNENKIFASIGIGPINNAFSSGRQIEMLKVESTGKAMNLAGVDTPVFGSSVASAELMELMKRSNFSSSLEAEYNKVNNKVLDSYQFLNQALASTANLAPLPNDTSLPNYSIAWQNNEVAASLRTILRCISAQRLLGVNRQVFFVNMRNFDTHSDQTRDLNDINFVKLDAAIGYFFQALATIGMENNVTLFTTTEFGRSLKSNGDGTDHGWGGLSFVVGGAVHGGEIYGNLPEIAENSNSMIGGTSPVLIPTISNQQYCSTLASWLGVPDSMLPDIFPNLNRFSPTKLGFL